MRMLLALAAASAALATPAAEAAVSPWVGVFDVSVSSGSVSDSWKLHHADAGPCDVAQSGSGSETGSLLPGPSAIMTVAGVGIAAFLTPVTGIRTVAQLDRQGSIDYGPDDGDDGDGCPSGGGEAAPPPDCGPTSLNLNFTLVPGTAPGLVADTSESGTRYLNCPVMGEPLPAVPRTLLAPTIVHGVGPAPGPGFVDVPVTGTDVDSDGDSDVTSALTVQLRFTRIAIVEALDLKDSYKTAPVDAHGDVRLPVACPAGKGCSGTIAIGTSDTGSETERAVTKAPVWPKPLTTPQVGLGATKFKLKGGQKTRVRIRLGRGSTQVIDAFAGQRLDVIVHQSAGKKHKPIAFVVGQVRLKAT